MARLVEGILGGFRGKVGPTVGYIRNGQAIIRSVPKLVKREPSEKQLKNRKAMAAAQNWLKNIKTVVRVTFKNYSKKQHGFGNALSYLKLHAINEDFTVDPSKVLISWGDLPVPVAPAVINSEPGVLEFTWEAENYNTDHVVILVYRPTGSYAELCGAKRSVGKQRIEYIGTGWVGELYMAFITEERDRCSNSVYLGSMIMK